MNVSNIDAIAKKRHFNVVGSMEEVKKFVEAKGGKVVSGIYLGVAKKMMFECAHGHQWETSFHVLSKKGTWCPFCAHPGYIGRFDGLERCNECAAKKSGVCLSSAYVNSKHKLRWKCSCEDHPEWDAAPDLIFAGRWCPLCADSDSRKDWLVGARALAAAKGGQCESEICHGRDDWLMWRCSNFEHGSWGRTYQSVANGHWCPQCTGARTVRKNNVSNFVQAQKIAQRKNGQLLSTDNLLKSLPWRWRCAKGHEFSKTLKMAERNWCNECNKESRISTRKESRNRTVHLAVKTHWELGENRYTLGDMIILAESKGGRFLSPEYQGATILHKFQCAQGHEWMAKPSKVKGGSWCPACARMASRIYDLEDLRSAAHANGGQCLSPSCDASYKKHLWKCKVSDHPPWMALPLKIFAGQWCPHCRGTASSKLQYERLARAFNGKLVGEYVNTLTPTTWECSAGHCFQKTPERVKAGRWCPMCWNKGEQLIRQTFERIFGIDFPIVRPKWLKDDPNGHNWTMDGMSDPLALAFEYQGSLHLRFNDHFHDSIEDLQKIQLRDARKVEICEQRGIALIVINQLAKVDPALAAQSVVDALNQKMDCLDPLARLTFQNWQARN